MGKRPFSKAEKLAYLVSRIGWSEARAKTRAHCVSKGFSGEVKNLDRERALADEIIADYQRECK